MVAYKIEYLVVHANGNEAWGEMTVGAQCDNDALDLASYMTLGAECQITGEVMVGAPGPFTSKLIARGKAFMVGGNVLPAWED